MSGPESSPFTPLPGDDEQLKPIGPRGELGRPGDLQKLREQLREQAGELPPPVDAQKPEAEIPAEPDTLPDLNELRDQIEGHQPPSQ